MLSRHVIGQQNGIFGAIIRGVDDGINIFRNSLDVGIRSFINHEPSENNDLTFKGDESEFNQNQDSFESEEPYSSTSRQRHEEDSMSEETHKQKDEYLIPKKDPINHTSLPVHTRKPQNVTKAIKHVAPTKEILLGNGYISNATLIEKDDFLSVDKINVSLTKNKDYSAANITTMLNDIINETSKPLIIVVNGTVIENTVPKVSVVNNSTINLNSTQTVLNDTVKNDNDKNVMKSITKTKFFFQVQPLRPMNDIKSENETIYYIDK
ncbi:unnamed protein product [Danaus chrysippus]|uniref:(African queen) hypothetical protein n=1 Tax=Danaus chrysippus TaxID=151541 RepID=A0A8J2R355_9NEOP|nr:unnamed protein product [Danaus chrysippus]